MRNLEWNLDDALQARFGNRHHSYKYSLLFQNVYTRDDSEKVNRSVTAHSLRGSCATNAFNNGATLEQAKQQLRHKNVTTTMIYLEEAQKAKNPVSDIIADQIL